MLWRSHVTRVLLLGLLVAFGLQWKSCIEPNRIHNDWRQVPHWRAEATQEFQPGDRLLEYLRFDASPFGNLLYGTLASTGIDAAWGKLNGMLWFACAAALLFLAARAMAPGRIAGWVAAAVFLLFPSQMEPFVGGFISGLGITLVCLSVFLAARKWWGWGSLVVAIQALIYPMGALLSGLMLLAAGLERPREWTDRAALRSRVAPLGLIAVVCIAVVVAGYLGGTSEFGDLAMRPHIGGRAEFSHSGRGLLLPTPSILAQLSQYFGSVSYLMTCLLAFLVLGKPMIRLPRVLHALLLVSFGLLLVADVLFIRLDDPGGYLALGLPPFVALSSGVWVARAIEREPLRTVLDTPLVKLRASPAVLGVGLLALIGLIEHGATFAPSGKLATRHFRRTALYDAIRELPAGIMLASHPRVASELPLMTGRSVVVTAEAALPWWSEHWNWSEERIQDILRAYYADEPGTLIGVSRRYGVDYWVVDRERYSSRSGGMYYQPWVRWAHRSLRLRGNSVLRSVPEEYLTWEGGAYFVVSTEDLERYAEELANRRGGARR